MTEKRFVEYYAGRTIKRLIGIKDIETNRVCVTIEENIQLLNELHEENQSFEIHSKWQGEKYSELLDSFTKMKKNYQLVKKENEQLKQFKKEVFDLIDKKIDEYQEYDGYDTEKYYIGTQLLKELKKELKGGDVE